MSPRKTLAQLAVAASIATALAPTGCTQNRANNLKREGESFLSQIGSGGQVIEPKRCLVSVTILPKPLNDKAVNAAVWSTADEQTVPAETRRVLEANGLRMGVLTGGLPAEVEAAVNAPPPDKVEPTEFNLPDGSPTLVTLAETTPTASLLLNREGRAFGKDYKEASGWLRVTATQDGPTGVALRFVPEIHHGPILRRFDAMPNNTGGFNAMPFAVKDGQQEDTLRDLAATLKLEPGQVAVIGCLPDRRGSLGSFLFTQAEANSDRLMQKVLLVRVSRSSPGIPGSRPTPSSRLEPVEPPDLPAPAEAKDDNDKPNEPEKGKNKDKDVARPQGA